jgi:hypothetical protein
MMSKDAGMILLHYRHVNKLLALPDNRPYFKSGKASAPRDQSGYGIVPDLGEQPIDETGSLA